MEAYHYEIVHHIHWRVKRFFWRTQKLLHFWSLVPLLQFPRVKGWILPAGVMLAGWDKL